MQKTGRTGRRSAARRIAERQEGRISLAQLRSVGISADAARKQARRGEIDRVVPGVYALWPAAGARARWWEAILACGPRALLSHWSAASLQDLCGGGTRPVHVTGGGRGRPGIVSHTGRLRAEDTTVVDGLPCTTVARTLLDLATEVAPDRLRRLCERAEELQVFDRRAILAHRGPGSARLRAVLADLSSPEPTRSELERRFLALCAAAALPTPQVNVPLAPGLTPDFAWPERRVVVETDGWASHGNRRAFREDRRRDRELTLAGWRVVRFSWEDVVRDAPGVIATLRALHETH